MPPAPHRLDSQAFAVAGQPVLGTLFLPEGDGWYPAAALAGDPPDDSLTQALLGVGFAVLTFEAPGLDLPEAALAAADSLLMRPDVRPDLIGLVGFGPGAWAAAHVAARAPETAFAVLVPNATPPPPAALAHLGDLLCPTLVLSPSEALTPTLAQALAHNPDTDLQPAPGDTPMLYAVLSAWLAAQVA